MLSSSSTFKTYSFKESMIFYMIKSTILNIFLWKKSSFMKYFAPPLFDNLCYALHRTIVALGVKRYNI